MPRNSPSPEAQPGALPPRPAAPEQSECCQGDCGPHCVFAVYERDLERWQDTAEALLNASTTPRRS